KSTPKSPQSSNALLAALRWEPDPFALGNTHTFRYLLLITKWLCDVWSVLFDFKTRISVWRFAGNILANNSIAWK
ncbi:hypothetical protein ACV355_31405, partial [Pseudomonas aeruginosa]